MRDLVELMKYERNKVIFDSVGEICIILFFKVWFIYSFILMCIYSMY